jgi:uracil-DNA glycosylase
MTPSYVLLDNTTSWTAIDLAELPSPVGWEEFFSTQTKNLVRISNNLKLISTSSQIYPCPTHVFRAFDLVKPADIKVVICGQDPYHTPDTAQGLAFSVSQGHLSKPINPSLRNIFKKVNLEGYTCDQKNSDLHRWARQGVFLINTILTVTQSKAKSHSTFGWDEFFIDLLKYLQNYASGVVYILWGSNAKIYRKYINTEKNIVLCGGHPCPLNRTSSFWDANYFRPCNDYLRSIGRDQIDWS